MTTAIHEAVDASEGIRDAWDKIAAGYDEFVLALLRPHANAALRAGVTGLNDDERPHLDALARRRVFTRLR